LLAIGIEFMKSIKLAFAMNTSMMTPIIFECRCVHRVLLHEIETFITFAMSIMQAKRISKL